MGSKIFEAADEMNFELAYKIRNFQDFISAFLQNTSLFEYSQSLVNRDCVQNSDIVAGDPSNSKKILTCDFQGQGGQKLKHKHNNK